MNKNPKISFPKWRFLSRCWLTIFILVISHGESLGQGDHKWQSLTASHSHYVEIDGQRLHYIIMGQGKPVVMIHGFADSTYCWHSNVEALVNAGLRPILVDQPGLGKSGVPPDSYQYSIENQAESILKLCDFLKLRRFSLAGSSMGGGIALYLTWRHPDRVERVALLDPACDEPPGMQWIALPGMGHVASVFGGRWTIDRGLKKAYYNGDLVTEAAIDEYARPAAREGYFQVLHDLASQFFSPQFNAMTKSYREIEAPVLIIWGQYDSWIPPAYGERLRKAIAGSRLEIIKDAGHLPHQEAPEVVNRLLVEFQKP